jgi:hypothetical protein
MAEVGGIKLANMGRTAKVSLGKNVGKISPDPYSYEHRLNLDQDAMSKIGMSKTPTVGDVFHVMGEGHVHSVNTDGAGNVSVGLQMRKLGVKKKSKGGAVGAVEQGIKDAG